MRLFLATTFPAPILRALNERVVVLRPKLPQASWVRPESQHLTFVFLGEQPESLVAELVPRLEAALATTRAFTATLIGCGFFPNPRRARVAWIGVEPEQRFVEVAGAVRQAVQQCGVALDRDSFKAHLTLLRMRDPWPPRSIETFNAALRDYRSEPFDVDEVTLYSSKLQPTGAVHTAVAHVRLARA